MDEYKPSVSSSPQDTRRTFRLEIGDNAFWLCLWLLGAIVILALVAGLLVKDAIWQERLAANPEPMKLMCAEAGGRSTIPTVCIPFLKGETK